MKWTGALLPIGLVSSTVRNRLKGDKAMSEGRGRLAVVLAVLLTIGLAGMAAAQDKPNILIIWGDDIGVHNISAYNHGIMGYRTPNIDRIAREGALFTDAYGEQSCTAGRAAFVLGQHPFRTGLLTIGMPGSPHGIPDFAPTIADLLKEQGYTTGQFGKNHLGDNNKHLPTAHGFDEFFGNLYHLNAEEEPQTYYYPKDPTFRQKYGPRGVLHARATSADDATVEPRWGRVGSRRSRTPARSRSVACPRSTRKSTRMPRPSWTAP